MNVIDKAIGNDENIKKASSPKPQRKIRINRRSYNLLSNVYSNKLDEMKTSSSSKLSSEIKINTTNGTQEKYEISKNTEKGYKKIFNESTRKSESSEDENKPKKKHKPITWP